MIVYKVIKSNLLGSPKWGINVPKGKKVLNLEYKDTNGKPLFVLMNEHDKIDKLKGSESKLKGKRLELNYFVHFKTDINFDDVDSDGNLIKSNKSKVEFRFHSSKKLAQMDTFEYLKIYGAYRIRFFIYDGIDKTESELIEWALNTDQFANDGKTTIYKAKEV